MLVAAVEAVTVRKEVAAGAEVQGLPYCTWLQPPSIEAHRPLLHAFHRQVERVETVVPPPPATVEVEAAAEVAAADGSTSSSMRLQVQPQPTASMLPAVTAVPEGTDSAPVSEAMADTAAQAA